MLCMPVFIFTSSSSALLGCPWCGLSIWLSLLDIFNTFFCVYANLFHKQTDKTQKHSKSVIFAWYENGCRWLLDVQTERASSIFLHFPIWKLLPLKFWGFGWINPVPRWSEPILWVSFLIVWVIIPRVYNSHFTSQPNTKTSFRKIILMMSSL